MDMVLVSPPPPFSAQTRNRLSCLKRPSCGTVFSYLLSRGLGTPPPPLPPAQICRPDVISENPLLHRKPYFFAFFLTSSSYPPPPPLHKYAIGTFFVKPFFFFCRGAACTRTWTPRLSGQDRATGTTRRACSCPVELQRTKRVRQPSACARWDSPTTAICRRGGKQV